MKIKKLLRKAYRRGRKEGFDKGLAVANMIYSDLVADLKRQIEELNNEIILGKEEENDGICQEE